MRTDRRAGVVRAEAITIDGHRVTTGARALRATAANAEGRFDTERFRLRDDVQIVDSDGRRLETDIADYDGKTERLTAPNAVRLLGSNFQVDGASAVADLAANTVQIGGPVRATIEPQPASSSPR